jgi:nucleolar protein 56
MEKRELFLKRAREETQEALRSRDMLLAHVAKAIDELNKVANLLHERLSEMYVLYFPELDIKDAQKHAELVVILDRSNLDVKELAKVIGQPKAEQLVGRAANSMGVEFKEDDLKACRMLAQRITQIHQLIEEYENYQEKLAQELCPNIAHVAGADIAAKLIARVGSLSRLAVLPASTIQVLGAEKALFKHLRNRKIDPPKHGIIFQHVRISSSPKKVRGKIARVLSNKIALAAKADGFTKRFIAENLKKAFDARYAEIMQQYEKEKQKQ